LTLQRHDSPQPRKIHAVNSYELGVIDTSGPRKLLGSAQALSGGEPWMLPVPGSIMSHPSRHSLQRQEQMFSISDYGYKIRVGKVVPTRERQRLRTKRGKRSLPLIWASDIRPDGTFVFGRGHRFGNPVWYDPPTETVVSYATRGPALLVQRTSNRDQDRRLNAAAVPSSFREEHHKHGFVAENHVITLEATSEKPVISPKTLAAVLNSAVVNERFSAVCGSFSVSAKLLERLALPDPKRIPPSNARSFDTLLRSAFKGLTNILLPLETSRDPQHTGDETGNVRDGRSVDKDSRFERRAVA
jgi:adenine-specific DNA-methyltransferase